jgi:hypothetical protein
VDFDLSIFETLSTQPNVFDGETIFDANHEIVGHTEPNLFGGENYQSADGSIIATSQPNIFGGIDINVNTLSNPFAFDVPDFRI